MSLSSYLIQVNIYLILFYSFYILVLQNETFFKLNRIFLVSSAMISLFIPLMQSNWVRTMLVTVEVAQVSIILNPNALQEIQISPIAAQQNLTIYDWISIVYVAGVLIFLIRFIWQLLKAVRNFDKGNRAQSFFKWIKVSEDIPSRDSIVKHEEIHARQLHSADVIFFELMAIVNWFNPVVYAYKKAAKYIHEFIADEAASKEGEKSQYALLLVSNAFGVQKEQLTNNFFNQSLLKKRIMMLHKTKSSKIALLKYGFSAPLFAAMIVLSSATIAESEINTINIIKEPIVKSAVHVLVSSDPGQKNRDINKIAKKGRDISKVTPNIVNNISSALSTDTSAIYDVRSIEVLPDYPGGISKFLEWVGANYKYPAAANKANISGRLIIQFVVEKDGSLSNINCVRDLGFGTGETAVELLKQSKKWSPGIQNGKPVRVKFTLPLSLHSNNNTSVDSLIVRRNSTLNSSNPPLIILDGKEVTLDYMKQIKSTDIKSVDVLKDKSATDKFGEKGKNGVLIITLKPKSE